MSRSHLPRVVHHQVHDISKYITREGYLDSRRCSWDTYTESYITKYTSIRRKNIKTVNCMTVGAAADGGVCGSSRAALGVGV